MTARSGSALLFRLGDRVTFRDNAKRQAGEQGPRPVNRQVNRMVGKRGDFQWNTQPPPGGVQLRRPFVQRVMNVHGEVKQSAGGEHSGHFLDDPSRARCVIDDIVAEDHVETRVRKWKFLASAGDRLRFRLPCRKQAAIFVGKRVHPYPLRCVEEENEAVRSGSDFQDARILSKRPDLFQPATHFGGMGGHRRHGLGFLSPDPGRLALLVDQLPLKRPLRSPLHSCARHTASRPEGQRWINRQGSGCGPRALFLAKHPLDACAGMDRSAVVDGEHVGPDVDRQDQLRAAEHHRLHPLLGEFGDERL